VFQTLLIALTSLHGGLHIPSSTSTRSLYSTPTC